MNKKDRSKNHGFLTLPFAILNAGHMWGDPMFLILFECPRHTRTEIFLIIKQENRYMELPERNYCYGFQESVVGVGTFIAVKKGS